MIVYVVIFFFQIYVSIQHIYCAWSDRFTSIGSYGIRVKCRLLCFNWWAWGTCSDRLCCKNLGKNIVKALEQYISDEEDRLEQAFRGGCLLTDKEFLKQYRLATNIFTCSSNISMFECPWFWGSLVNSFSTFNANLMVLDMDSHIVYVTIWICLGVNKLFLFSDFFFYMFLTNS